jgi:hypothetical protein
MEETNINFTDEENICLPDGVYTIKDENLEELSISLDDKTRTYRKASVVDEDDTKCEREIESQEKKELNIQVIEKDEYRYIGETKKDLRDGFGICYFKNGDVYKGQWRFDKKEGLGIMVYKNGSVMKGELWDDNFSGFCKLNENRKTITGYYRGGRFYDIVIVTQKNKYYEGEIAQDDTKISLGKLVWNHTNKQIMGEIYDYNEGCGFGILINNSNCMYLGEVRNKIFQNYIEVYNLEGGAYFGITKDSLKNGICFSFYKDGKVSFGNYINNFKNGPFLNFSNYQNLAKSSVRLELFHFDFKSKFVDKMEPSKKYLQLNYPEYCYILNIHYQEIISKLSEVLVEEMAFFNSLVKK